MSSVHKRTIKMENDDTGIGNIDYVCFFVDKKYINASNAVIDYKLVSEDRMRLERNDPNAWSWHIWVTDTSLIDLVKFRKLSGRTGDLISVLLGFASDFTTISKERQVTIEHSNGTKSKTIVLTQKANHTLDGKSFAPSMTLYQHGRKDPFVGAVNSQNQLKRRYVQNGYPCQEEILESNSDNEPMQALYIMNSRKSHKPKDIQQKALDSRNSWNWCACRNDKIPNGKTI